MQFGKVEHPENIDFILPKDHANTAKVLGASKTKKLSIFVGCAKWNRQDLKGFYPKGTKDELEYYSKQFNSIELNATFYRMFSADQLDKWYHKTPEGFKFFPKVIQDISHFKRLGDNVQPLVDQFLANVFHLKEKLGTIFLQMHSNFSPIYFDRMECFVNNWPKDVPLAIELRHKDWSDDSIIADELFDLLYSNNIAYIITDTAGRRDLLHMRLTNKEAFVRYVGANHQTDYGRLKDWVDRLYLWKCQGIQDVHFFVHQNIEAESPLLSRYFIELLNNRLGVELKLPNHSKNNLSLF